MSRPARFRAEHLSIIGATIALFAPLILVVASGRVMPMTDMRGFHIPTRELYQQALQNGGSILWTPAIYSGAYLHGEGQVGELHPLHLLLYRFLPLFPAIGLELLLNYVIAFGGSLVLFRRVLAVPWISAWLGALFFTFSGYMLMHAAHLNMVAVLAHAPWTWWLTDVILAGGPAKRAPGALALAAVTASQWLLGFPQAIYFTLLGSACLVCIRVATTRQLAPVAWLAASMALGTAMAAVQILPTLDMAGYSYRARGGAIFAEIYSLHPVNVIQLWAPYTWPSRVYTVDEPPIPHEFALYDGAFATIAIVLLAIRLRALDRAARLAVLGAASFGAVFLVLAFGRFGYLQPLLTEVTGLALFRAPTRQIFLVHFALAALCGLAFDDLLAIRRGARVPAAHAWLLWIPLAAAIASVALINRTPHWFHSVDGAAAFPAAARSIAWMTAITVLTFASARGWRWGLPILLLVAAADLGWWGYSFALDETPLTRPALLAQAIVPPEGRPGEYIWRPDQSPDGNLPVMYGYRLADGYLALSPKRLMGPESPAAQRIQGVRWSFTGERWRAVPDPLPRVRLVTETQQVRPWAVRVVLPRIDVSRVATVDRDVGPLDGTPGSASLVVDRPGELVIQTRSTGRQLLVIAERFHEGWRALEGCDAGPFAVYGEMMGCTVPAGVRQITLRFEPRSFTIGARISLVALAVWVSAALLVTFLL